jgi:23S rRNA (uridine2552-2'-O)-methyltransferase
LKKNKVSKNWIIRQKRDIYVRQSHVDGFRSRAVYKLQQIDQKFKILKNNSIFIDLGAAPGSWSQYLAEKFNKSKIYSIDIKKMEDIKNVNQIVGDFTDSKVRKDFKELINTKADVVLSDMAENTTGNKNIDAIVTGELCKSAMDFAKEMLSKNGVFVSKIFMGLSFNEIVAEAKSIFKETHVYKPLSSRKESKESFIICKILR